MEFDKIVMKRYAAKTFDGKKVPQEKLNKLLELARYAASSYNFQPWKIIVIESKELKEKLAPVAWNQPQITTCSHLLVFCANTDLESIIDTLEEQTGSAEFAKMLRDFAAGLQGEKRLAWAQRQVYLALANAINGATALGFDSCPMEGFSPPDFAKILGLPKHIVPTALCAIGYATDEPRPKQRLPEEDVVVRK